jgi:hypothetical protein
MWKLCEIVLKSYLPKELEVDMIFVNRISVGVIDPYIELFMLEEVPEDADAFMSKYGAPVELIIIDEYDNVHAIQDNIGWWYDEEYLEEITLEDINYIFKEYTKPDFDKKHFDRNLGEMLKYITKIQKSEITQDKASEVIGTLVAKQYIPQLKDT